MNSDNPPGGCLNRLPLLRLAKKAKFQDPCRRTAAKGRGTGASDTPAGPRTSLREAVGRLAGPLSAWSSATGGAELTRAGPPRLADRPLDPDCPALDPEPPCRTLSYCRGSTHDTSELNRVHEGLIGTSVHACNACRRGAKGTPRHLHERRRREIVSIDGTSRVMHPQ